MCVCVLVCVCAGVTVGSWVEMFNCPDSDSNRDPSRMRNGMGVDIPAVCVFYLFISCADDAVLIRSCFIDLTFHCSRTSVDEQRLSFCLTWACFSSEPLHVTHNGKTMAPAPDESRLLRLMQIGHCNRARK